MKIRTSIIPEISRIGKSKRRCGTKREKLGEKPIPEFRTFGYEMRLTPEQKIEAKRGLDMLARQGIERTCRQLLAKLHAPGEKKRAALASILKWNALTPIKRTRGGLVFKKDDALTILRSIFHENHLSIKMIEKSDKRGKLKDVEIGYQTMRVASRAHFNEIKELIGDGNAEMLFEKLNEKSEEIQKQRGIARVFFGEN